MSLAFGFIKHSIIYWSRLVISTIKSALFMKRKLKTCHCILSGAIFLGLTLLKCMISHHNIKDQPPGKGIG